MQYPINKSDNKIGLFAATAVIVLWTLNLSLILTSEISAQKWYLIPQFFVQILLYTGLFITAHDAMHGLVSPENRLINDVYGKLSLVLFALFSFNKTLKLLK